MRINWKEKMNKTVKVYGIYTLLFLIVLFLSFLPFLQERRSLLWNPDAVVYHIPMAEVFADVLRRIADGWSRGVFLTWGFYDFSIGMGTDMLQYISQWYMEPLNVLYAFFDVEKAEILYELLVIARLYLCGISFLLFSRVLQKKDAARIMGALVYVFSGYTLFTATKAPPFLGAMILLPMILLGYEKVKKGQSKVLFILMIACSAIFSFYFLFMNSLFLAIYVLIDFCVARSGVKEAVGKIGCLIGYYLIGFCMGGFSVLPFVGGFLNSSRSGGVRNAASLLLYDGAYYSNLLKALFVARPEHSYWLVLGFSPLVLVALAVVWLRKDGTVVRLKAAWIVGVAGLCVPLFGLLMNAGKVSNERWLYGLVFAAAVTLCVSWESMSDWITNVLPVKANRRRTLATAILTGVLLVTMIANGYFLFSDLGSDFVSEFHKMGKGYSILTDNSNLAMDHIEDDSLYRVDSTRTPKTASSAWVAQDYRGLVTNASGYSSEMADYYRFMENAAVITGFRLTGMDQSTIQTTLAGVKYYTTSKGQESKLPYGYSEVTKDIYCNENALPFGYTYDTYVLQSDLEQKTPVEKQEAMLSAAVVDDKQKDDLQEAGLKKLQLDYASCQLDYSIQNCKNVSVSEDLCHIQALEKGAGFDLIVDNIPGPGEIYVQWKGLSLVSDEITAATINLSEEDVVKTYISYQNPDNTYSSGMDTYAANVGYAAESKRVIHVSFTQAATYNAQEANIYYLPLEGYEEKVAKLSQDALQIAKWSDTYIAGEVETKTTKLLCVPVLYSSGWKLYVNGEKQELKKVNLMYSGVLLEEGKHEIVLKYESPFLKLGAFVSLIGLGLFAGLGLAERKKQKK